MTCDFTIPPFFPLTEYVWLQDFFYATVSFLAMIFERIVRTCAIFTLCRFKNCIICKFSRLFLIIIKTRISIENVQEKKTFVIGLVALVIISIIQDFLTLSAKKFFCLLCLFYCLVAILIMLLAGLYLSNYFFFLLLFFRYFLFLLWSIWLISLIPYPIFYFYLNFFWTVLI